MSDIIIMLAKQVLFGNMNRTEWRSRRRSHHRRCMDDVTNNVRRCDECSRHIQAIKLKQLMMVVVGCISETLRDRRIYTNHPAAAHAL